jgi:uracil-DNA glycosylase family 4
MRGRDKLLVSLQAECRACHVCVDQGIIPEANPTFEGRWGVPFFLVGQAPGPVERESRRPFSGRAGKELDRWMVRSGFESAEEFRRLTYIAALMRCFPGRNRAGSGDLKPPPAAVANCAHWLDAELRLIKPKVMILVGQLAIARFLGPGRLEDRVGRSFGDRPVMVPLPHPSGQSRWLNDPANRERLAGALELLGQLRTSLAPAPRSRSNNDGGSQKLPRAQRATTKAMRRKA